MRKRVWISGGLLLLILLFTVGGILLLVKNEHESKARIQSPIRRVSIEVREVVPRAYTRWVEAYSTVAPFRKGTVSAQVTGPIVMLAPNTEPGMTVHKDQEMAKIEDTRYRLTLQKATANLKKLQALLAIERNENERRTAIYRIAKQRLALVQADYERNLELFQKEIIAKQTLENAENQLELRRLEFENARSELQSRQARIQSIQADLTAARAEIDRLREDLADTVVRSPFDGVIGDRFVELGDQVAPGQRLFTVLEISSVKVVARTPSEFIGRIETGIPAEVTTRAYPSTIFNGTVIHVYPEADPKNRTFAVEVEVDNQVKPMLLPGMFARVRVPIMTLNQALLVPRDALMEDDRGIYLYVVDHSNRTSHRRNVVIGYFGPEEAVVTEGLSAGDAIVVRGQEMLDNGTPVEWTASSSSSVSGNSIIPTR
ncbi:MAG: efflux RND transporter periplasmic adaptor subunit [Syntrophobacterales bacterium]|nr:MAG: efflux RND transporter periplasmic adaptor subunit [Syntrophobacterales bacterium]